MTSGGAGTSSAPGLGSATTPDVACAVWARREGVDPLGTALSFTAYLLVEWPLPWPSDTRDEPRFAPLVEVMGSDVRLNAVVPTSDDTTARRVILYRRRADDDGWFRSFDRTERVVPHDRIVETAVEMLQADDEPVASSSVTDVLVCTHGSRDVCCGSRGVGLLRAIPDGLDDMVGDTVRLWRSSHIGSHHFAPNVMLLPSGTVWGLVDPELLVRVLARQGRVDDILAHYRGCVGLATPAQQAVERAGFRQVGWPWLDHQRRGVALDGDRVRVEARDGPGGSTLTWEAVVRPGRRMAIPPCRPPTPPPGEFASEVVVSEVRASRAGVRAG